MKFVILQGDGMADYPVESLGDKTPLEAAKTTHMDRLAADGLFGLAYTIPEGLPPGSDVGNMSILGYDSRRCYTGRAPLEAASMGIPLNGSDVAFRCNLVTLKDQGSGRIMEDFAAGHISSEEAAELIGDVGRGMAGHGVEFYPGVSYRHLMVWRNGEDQMETTPPHDITDRETEPHLPRGKGAGFLCQLMESSRGILAGHSVNCRRKEKGEREATSIWLWGQGKAPRLPSLQDRFGINGAVISAVDLVRGLGVYAGLERVQVPGITGFLDTNYRGKADYGLDALNQKDLIFIHVEAPDEAGHMGSAEEKVKAIEAFDEKVVGTVIQGLKRWDEWRLLLLPDHATPVALKTHAPGPVPFVLYSSAEQPKRRPWGFNERDARASGVVVNEAHRLIEGLIEGRPVWIET